MRAFTMILVAAMGLGLVSEASAAVFVHAGPVHVAVGRRPVARPVARPVRPAYVAPRPFVVAPAIVAPAPVIRPVAPVVPARAWYWRHEVRENIHDAIENAMQNAAQ